MLAFKERGEPIRHGERHLVLGYVYRVGGGKLRVEVGVIVARQLVGALLGAIRSVFGSHLIPLSRAINMRCGDQH